VLPTFKLIAVGRCPTSTINFDTLLNRFLNFQNFKFEKDRIKDSNNIENTEALLFAIDEKKTEIFFENKILLNNNNEIVNSLWREYELSSKQLTCHFLEVFEHDFLNFVPNKSIE
jgi:hypothetical protein